MNGKGESIVASIDTATIETIPNRKSLTRLDPGSNDNETLCYSRSLIDTSYDVINRALQQRALVTRSPQYYIYMGSLVDGSSREIPSRADPDQEQDLGTQVTRADPDQEELRYNSKSSPRGATI